MPGLEDQVAQALREGTAHEAAARVFIDVLGWEPDQRAIATDGATRVVVGLGQPGEIGVRGREGVVELSWHEKGTVRRIVVERDAPSAFALSRLTSLKRGSPVSPAFEVRSLSSGFMGAYTEVFDRHLPQVVSGTRKKYDEETARSVLHRLLLRVLLVAFLQSNGWLVFRGRRDYLQSLYKDWVLAPAGRLFHQRLALFFQALDEPREEARSLLEPQIGSVPFVGGGLFSAEQYEKEGLSVFPDALYADLLAREGLVSRFSFAAMESAPDEEFVAVTPEVLGAVMGSVLLRESAPTESTADHRRAVRRLVAAQLGGLQPVGDRSEWLDGLRGLHVFDGECKTGTYLVAALEELTDLRVAAEGGERGKVKRLVAQDNLRGLERDEPSVQVARIRLALAVLSSDASPRPLPDLRTVVRQGGTLVAPRPLPPEGPQVEYKAAFEWDVRRGQRSGDLRFGCLRTVAAFLNSEGGTLYIGVDDRGVPVGLDDDFALIEDASPCDVFEGRFREFLKNSLDPMPLNAVALDFQEMEGKVVCLVRVSAGGGVTYLTHKDANGQRVESVFVRDGNRTIELRGRDRDAFILARRL